MKYVSLDTEAISKAEKGEGDHLLSDEFVKPLKSKSSFNIFRCLCKTLVALFILLLVTLVTTVIAGFVWTRHQVQRITVPAEKDMPQPPLPVAPVPKVELEVIKDEAILFWDQLRANMEPKNDLTITLEQMNGLFANSDFFRGHAFMTMDDNELEAEFVLPANKLPGGKGRYFMGKASLSTMDDDEGSHFEMKLTPKYHIRGLDFDTILFGKFLAYFATDRSTMSRTPVANVEYGQFLNWVAPEDWIERHENILSCDHVDKHDDDFDRKDCQEVMKTLGRLESISFQDGKIVFTPHRSSDGGQGRKLKEIVEGGSPNKNSFPSFSRLARRALGGMF